MKHFLCILILWAIFSTVSQAQTSRVISGSTNFSVKFVLGTCDGTFEAPKGSAVFDESNPGKSSFHLTINASSFQTGNKTRDKDMKSEKYFHVAKFPEIKFTSSKVEKAGTGYHATGILTIRDVSKNVTLPFEARKNKEGGYTLSSQFELNRLDYHIGEKDWKLKDMVTVKLTAEIR